MGGVAVDLVGDGPAHGEMEGIRRQQRVVLVGEGFVVGEFDDEAVARVEGVGERVEDAAALQDASVGTVFTSDGISSAGWDEAIRKFNIVRAGRTARVQRTARVWGESWHVAGLARTLRNLLFNSRKDNNFQYNDWLYGQEGDGVPAVEPKRVAEGAAA